MQRSRLLLPFTHGVNCLALDYAVKLAKSRNAVLVPLSLIPVRADKSSKGARLEFIQQSQDFLASVQYRAAQLSVPVEVSEVYTADVIGSIKDVVYNKNCDGVLLFLHSGVGVLLNTLEVKHIMTEIAGTHNIIHLPTRAHSPQTLMQRFCSLLHRQAKQDTPSRVGLFQ
jgi:hypothetical protein